MKQYITVLTNFMFSDEIDSLPSAMPVCKSSENKANPNVGVSLMEFSADCKYICTINGQLHVCTLSFLSV